MSPNDIGANVIVVVGVLTALGWLGRRAYRALKFGEVVAQLVGKPGEPTLRESVIGLTTQIQSVKDVALRSEKELHPNGGSSLRDDVRAAAVAAAAAAQVAEDLGVRLEAQAQEASAERQQIRGAMTEMRQDIADDYARNTADALDLLAEHGGPDLRPHMKPNVVPHVHEIPTHDPDVTSPPIPPPED